MREYGFSLTRILPYKDKIYDFVLIRENPVFSHILCSELEAYLVLFQTLFL